jgi:hypothetical protein
LDQLTAGHRAETDSAARVYHPVPGDGGPLRQRVQSVTDLAGVTREAREGGDLPIRSDATLGDPADDGVDAVVAVRAHWKSGAPLHAARDENDTGDDR